MKDKILILVKTYPNISKKYFEIVCTAGINEKGEWRRVYPIPFRNLKEVEKYKKYQWLEVDIERNYSVPRPESYKLINQKIKIITEKPIETKNNWEKRKKILFKNHKTTIYSSLEEVITKAKANELSLCFFKPKKITKFSYEETDRNWNKKILKALENEKQQLELFPEIKKDIRILKKLPYKFYYSFTDKNNLEARLMIEDWEIGQLYWNCLRRSNSEQKVLEDVRKKYEEEFLSKHDITLFLGTTRKYHNWSKNPFLIIGVFYPKKANYNAPVTL